MVVFDLQQKHHQDTEVFFSSSDVDQRYFVFGLFCNRKECRLIDPEKV